MADDKVLALKKKIERMGMPLKDWDVKINRGIITGFNEAFIIDTPTKERLCQEDPKSAEILKPILRGRDIGRYCYEWAGLWVIIAKYDFNTELHKYPAILKHLTQYEEQLKNRGQCRYSRGGIRQGQHHWLELDNNPKDSYLAEFEQEKIVWADIATIPTFSCVPAGIYANNTCYLISNAPKWMIGLLNSKLVEWYFPQIASNLSKGGSRYFKQFVELLPIPKIPESEQKPFVDLVSRILVLKASNPAADTRELEAEIDRLVYELYDLTEEEIAIIEGNIKGANP